MLKKVFTLLVALSLVAVLQIVYKNSLSSHITAAMESYSSSLHFTGSEITTWSINIDETEIADATLEFLQLNRNDVLSNATEVVPNYCANLIQNDEYYKLQVDRFLEAWFKFVPPQSEMDSSNCWYAKNIDSRTLSIAKKKLKKDMSRNFYESYKNSWNSITGEILDNIISSGNKVDISTKPTKNYFCLPKVDLIGLRKTGSTSMFNNIASHPLLAEPRIKESQFWREFSAENDQKYRELAVLAYLLHFFGASHAINTNPKYKFTVDASVSTLIAMPHPARELEKDACVIPLVLSKAMPKIKLLVSVRDPTERLWSDYVFFCSEKQWKQLVRSTRSPNAVASAFHNNTIAAIQEFRTCTKSGHSQLHCVMNDLENMRHDLDCHKLRLGASMYYVTLVRWLHVFPRDQLLVTRLEDLSSDPLDTMDKIWEFIGLPSNTKFTPKVKNESPWRSKYDKDEFGMFPETRKLLDEFFHPYNVKLAELLGDNRFLWN